MSMEDTGDRSAAQIEREVEQTRARLTGTVQELKERVSPAQMADQALAWLRDSGGQQFLGNLGTTIRDNPVPILLIGAGVGWLALSNRSGTPRMRRDAPEWRAGSLGGEDYADAYAGESYPAQAYAPRQGNGGPSLTARVGDTASGLRDQAGEFANRAGEAAGDIRDKASELAGRASQAAGDAWNSARDAVQSVAGGAASGTMQRAGEAWNAAADATAGVGRRVDHYVREKGVGSVTGMAESQPLLLGALGLAIGAAIGALLPSSEPEDRLMGERRDRVAGQISSLASQAYDTAREAAGEQMGRAEAHFGEAYDRAKEKVSDANLQTGASVLGEVARGLREAVENTAKDATGAVREAGTTPEPEKDADRPVLSSNPAATGTPPV